SSTSWTSRTTRSRRWRTTPASSTCRRREMPNAVMWRAHSDLFPLVNKSLVVEALSTKYAYKHKPNRQGLNLYTNPILDVPYRLHGSGETVRGFKLLWVYGAVPYHVDALYPPYTYHLLLRCRNYMVVGEKRPAAFSEDKVGDLIALNVFEPHALYHRKNSVS